LEPGVEDLVFAGEILRVEFEEGDSAGERAAGRVKGHPDSESRCGQSDEVDDGFGLGGRGERAGEGKICRGVAKQRGEQVSLGAVETYRHKTGQLRNEGRGEDGGERIGGDGAVAGFIQLTLDEGGEDTGIAMGELLAELGSERGSDGEDGRGEHDERRRDGEAAGGKPESGRRDGRGVGHGEGKDGAGSEVEFNAALPGVGAVAVGGDIGSLFLVDVFGVGAEPRGPAVFDAGVEIHVFARAGNRIENGDDLEGEGVGGPAGLAAERPIAEFETGPDGGTDPLVVGKAESILHALEMEAAQGGLELVRGVPGVFPGDFVPGVVGGQQRVVEGLTEGIGLATRIERAIGVLKGQFDGRLGAVLESGDQFWPELGVAGDGRFEVLPIDRVTRLEEESGGKFVAQRGMDDEGIALGANAAGGIGEFGGVEDLFRVEMGQ